MGCIRQEFDDFYGTCCIEYCKTCEQARNDLETCPGCGFLFCSRHLDKDEHNCRSKHRAASA